MEHSPKPLAGLKVVELGTLIAGPFASRICAEFGAEVIKIESPDGGDPLRKWRKLYEGTSLWWFVQARNKKSLTLNLKRRGPGDPETPARRCRHPDRELPPRRTGKARPGLGCPPRAEPAPGDGAPVGLRPDRPLGPAGLRRGRRVDGRTALHYRLRGPPAGSHRDFHRRLDRRPVGVIGALMALTPRGQRRRGSDGRRRPLRGDLRHDGKHGSGIRRVRFHPRAHRQHHAGHHPSSIHTSADGRHVQIGANGDAIFRRFMQAIGRDDLASDPRLASNDGAMRAATNSMGLSTAGSPRSPWRKCWRCWREPKSRPAASTPPKTCSAIRNSLPARCSSRHACRTVSHSACLASCPSCPPRQARRIG